MRPNVDSSLMGFFVSRSARDYYQFDWSLFAPIGKTLIPNIHTARQFAQFMNRKRDLVRYPEQAVYASEINAIALIAGLTQFIFRTYLEQHPGLLQDALGYLGQQFGVGTSTVLDKFLEEFPPMAVYSGLLTRDQWLAQYTNQRSNREIALEELILLWISNENHALAPYHELFGDAVLENTTPYTGVMSALYQYFGRVAADDLLNNRSVIGRGLNIFDFLLGPLRGAPGSLDRQLEMLLGDWNSVIGGYSFGVLRGLDLLHEEHKPVFTGPGPTVVPVYDSAVYEVETEQFTADREWMPNLVLLAKNAYVWLDQLSKKYGRRITTLDQIPDAELDMLARWGFTGLWLIGLWERSIASQTIKRLCGNPDAVASAYSLLAYRIAENLGGEAACQNLRMRAWRRGIRLASDMVPNHVGIDGRWVIEHPDWFISLPYSPFPNYTFNGPDLSLDDRVGIYIEDHYYDRTDAAVVFKRVDRWTGDEMYIYHGNDGTTMPWNDTAQLDYLNPDLREAMIQTILYVARQFPIIRFDAAMTLVKRHFHRLWFPEPGSGGAIPSRAEQGMTRAQLDALMPEEFWREVVDRAAVEAPDTLLLAEAFWLMESYFVRTLGMHRVYNSAYMNMLRDEENAKYRLVMKNTLEFDPEVLKRFVNFMNNPDEKTAVEQFGKGDKYFGICSMMVTMPGLPMIGHGQVEGFTEKYGMEYQRAYYNEQPDGQLVSRHEREIFPLMKKRSLFAGVDNFLLYDFVSVDGSVNEDVFAYSNRVGDERALVVYHNRFATAQGWLRQSVGFSIRTGFGDERMMVQRTLSEGLALENDDQQYCIFRDHSAGLEYIRNNQELCEQGLYIELQAYQYHVFLDFRIVTDDAAHQYSQVAAYLAGRGVPSIKDAITEIFLGAVLAPFRDLVNAHVFRQLYDGKVVEADQIPSSELLAEVDSRVVKLLIAADEFIQAEHAPGEEFEVDEERIQSIAEKLHVRLDAILRLTQPEHPLLEIAAPNHRAVQLLQSGLNGNRATWYGLVAWLFVHALGEMTGETDIAQHSRSLIDEWMLGKIVAGTLRELGLAEAVSNAAVAAIKIATTHQALFESGATERPDQLLAALLQDSDVQQYLGINRYNNVLWFNKESFDQLLIWLLAMGAITAGGGQRPNRTGVIRRYTLIEQLRYASATSGYKVAKLRARAARYAATVGQRTRVVRKVDLQQAAPDAQQPHRAARRR